MSTWSDAAAETIARVHAALPEGVSLSERTKAIDAAYPFGSREYSPYKTWLKARRAYLVKYGHTPRNAPHESPLERMMRRSA